MMHCIDIIAGARPNFVKVAPVIRALQHEIDLGWQCKFRLVHTGQHYDYALSQSFFDQLQIPAPDINLGVGSGSQGQQTASILTAYETILMQDHVDLILVFGDVNSTMACSLAAAKLDIAIGHIEGGIRSHDRKMPEEINRIVTDALSTYFFTTTPQAGENLLAQGVKENRIFWVGNTMIDSLLQNRKRFFAPDVFKELSLKDSPYVIITLHRPSNVDFPDSLISILRVIEQNAAAVKFVFPAHPRTAKMLREINFTSEAIHIIEPLSYLEFNFLVMHSVGVITDSGGITEETTVLNMPCITLRENTERPETCTLGTNVLVGKDMEKFAEYVGKMVHGQWHKGQIPELWDGKSSERIVRELQRLLP